MDKQYFKLCLDKSASILTLSINDSVVAESDLAAFGGDTTKILREVEKTLKGIKKVPDTFSVANIDVHIGIEIFDIKERLIQYSVTYKRDFNGRQASSRCSCNDVIVEIINNNKVVYKYNMLSDKFVEPICNAVGIVSINTKRRSLVIEDEDGNVLFNTIMHESDVRLGERDGSLVTPENSLKQLAIELVYEYNYVLKLWHSRMALKFTSCRFTALNPGYCIQVLDTGEDGFGDIDTSPEIECFMFDKVWLIYT